MAARKGVSAKGYREELKKRGAFYTDEALAKYLKSLLPDDVQEVYDPTCGNGNLLAVFPDKVRKYGQDINAEQVEEARKLPNFHGAAGDTLLNPAFADRKFKAIVGNFPFSVKWDPDSLKDAPMFEGWPKLPPRSKADFAFIAHMLWMLTDDGTAVTVASPGLLYRGQAEGKIREYLLENGCIESVEDVDAGHFEDTSISTCILVLKRHRDSRNVHFKHNEYEADVTLEQIRENSWNLNTQRYLDEPIPGSEPIDIDKVNADVKKLMVSNLDKKLQMQQMIYELENRGETIAPLLDEIEAIVAKYRNMLREGQSFCCTNQSLETQ